MTRQTRPRRPAPPAIALSPRNIVLAGLGAVSLGRQQARQAAADFAQGADALRARAEAAVRKARQQATRLEKQARQEAARFEKQAKATLAPIARQAAGLAGQAQARIRPVLARVGLAAKKAPARRAPRRAARPAAKRTGKRA